MEIRAASAALAAAAHSSTQRHTSARSSTQRPIHAVGPVRRIPSAERACGGRSREAQDEYALLSYERAAASIASGAFDAGPCLTAAIPVENAHCNCKRRRALQLPSLLRMPTVTVSSQAARRRQSWCRSRCRR